MLDEEFFIKAEKIKISKEYLNSTDWYYARKLETGVEVPLEVVNKRTEIREFLQANGY
jgi:hypothetical protein